MEQGWLIGFLSESLFFCEKMSESVIRSKKRAIRSFAHFWCATWAIRSCLLIFGEQPERFANLLICHELPERFDHGRSFDTSDLSNLLTVAHLSWGIWANRFEQFEQMSKWGMREWANSQPCHGDDLYLTFVLLKCFI